MDQRKVRNRILIFLVLAGVVAYVLVRLSGREPVAKIAAVSPVRDNLVSSISSNGKVEPISPFVMRAPLDTFVEKVAGVEGQAVKKGQLLVELNVKDASAQLADAQGRLLRAQDELRAAQGGGKPDEAARVAGDLAKAQADRDRLQKNHESLERLVAKQAATRDELAANDFSLANAQAEVKRLSAAKQEFERAVKLDAGRSSLQVQQAQSEIAALRNKVASARITAPRGWNIVFAAGESRGLREDRRFAGRDGGLTPRAGAGVHRRAGAGCAGARRYGENYLGRAAQSQLDGQNRSDSQASGGARDAQRGGIIVRGG